MSSRITVLEGFGYHKRRRRKSPHRGDRRAQQSKMKKCAIKWRRAKSGSYRSFMKKCLKK